MIVTDRYGSYYQEPFTMEQMHDSGVKCSVDSSNRGYSFWSKKRQFSSTEQSIHDVQPAIFSCAEKTKY